MPNYVAIMLNQDQAKLLHSIVAACSSPVAAEKIALGELQLAIERAMSTASEEDDDGVPA